MTKPLMPLADALQYVLAAVKPTQTVLEIPLSDALGSVLAQTMRANIDVPAYDNSAMDGYALKVSDVDSVGTRLPMSQTIAAGHPGQTLAAGSIARIFTGAPIPVGANAVVMQENTVTDGSNIVINELPQAGQNIRRKGHDIASGTDVLQAGHRLQAQDLGLLASLGIGTISIYKPLTVAILNTGDEVIAPGTPLQAGQLYDSNSYTLAGLLSKLGVKVIKLGIVEDNLASTEAALQQAATQADCIISTGGVSVGDEDHVKQALENLGQLSLWKLAIKPGKPFSFGHVGNTPFFGLPGNPVAVFITFVMLVRPFLLRMQGATNTDVPSFSVKAGFNVIESGTRQEFLRVRLVRKNNELEVEAFADQGSSILTSLSWADGIAIIPVHTTINAGESVEYLPFSGLL
ncbi:MAG: gephyrin-like molybdotransferase Glp [Pseudomonadota bacterium]